MKRDKEGHYIIIKRSIQEDKTIINIYAPNIGAPQYVRQMLTSILYAEYIKRNAGLEEAQAGIKIAGRNINISIEISIFQISIHSKDKSWVFIGRTDQLSSVQSLSRV